MAVRSLANLSAFVRRSTRLEPVAGLHGVRLHVADDVMELCAATGRELGIADPSLPYWAFPWAGGLGVARHLEEHPDEVRGRRVLDLATGSGLCAIVAARAGAEAVEAVDVDPFADAAARINARANHVRIDVRLADVLADEPPDVDVVLAGDVAYEETMAGRMAAWLGRAAARGTRVLLGDPGRRYLPAGLLPVATYRVTTSRELEDRTTKDVTVYTIPPASRAG